MLLLTIFFSLSISAKEIKLSEDNTLVLAEAFTSRSVAKLIQQATKLDANLKSGYPIYLFLYTPGGSIQAGLELFEYLKGLNRPVHTITLFAASMGFQTVQHLGKRYILNYGVLMAHKARGGFRGEFGGGLSQLDARYGMWLRRINMMDELAVKRSNGKQTLKSYRAAYDNELWLNGPEAVKGGYADEVVTVKCDLSLQKTVTEVFDLGFFSIKAVYSSCPLNTAPLSVTANIVTNKGEMDLNTFIIKNGKFGKNCRSTSTRASKDYYGNITPARDAELCAADVTLTLEKINKSIENKTAELGKDLKDHIQYSY